MRIQWKLFADLAEHAGERELPAAVEPGDTVGDALEALLTEREALADRVLDDDGELRSQINVLQNGKDVRTQAEGLETTLEAGDELALFPPVSGGERWAVTRAVSDEACVDGSKEYRQEESNRRAEDENRHQ